MVSFVEAAREIPERSNRADTNSRADKRPYSPWGALGFSASPDKRHAVAAQMRNRGRANADSHSRNRDLFVYRQVAQAGNRRGAIESTGWDCPRE
jgi:hypothetical protein